MKYLGRWRRFIGERFDVATYSTMILVFVGAHYCAYLAITGQSIQLLSVAALRAAYLFFVAFLFFFRLRLMDEVKDYDYDVLYHPKRPLPSGILAKKDLIAATLFIVSIEFVFFAANGKWPMLGAISGIVYSFFMFKEFFLKKWLRPHLTAYAVVHTAVVFIFSLTIFLVLTGAPLTGFSAGLIYFAAASWPLFNIFEFGRKSFASEEEKEGINSYSKIFGRPGAVLLVLLMAAAAGLLLAKALPVGKWIFPAWSVLLAGSGGIYVFLNRSKSAKVYRAITSAYIVLMYATVIVLVICSE